MRELCLGWRFRFHRGALWDGETPILTHAPLPVRHTLDESGPFPLQCGRACAQRKHPLLHVGLNRTGLGWQLCLCCCKPRPRASQGQEEIRISRLSRALRDLVVVVLWIRTSIAADGKALVQAGSPGPCSSCLSLPHPLSQPRCSNGGGGFGLGDL